MRAFTYDVESVELTGDECSAFAEIVSRSCHRPIQAQLSGYLSYVCRPYSEQTIISVSRQVDLLWLTEARL